MHRQVIQQCVNTVRLLGSWLGGKSRRGAVWGRGYPLLAGLAVFGGVLAMGRPFLRRHGLGPPLPHTDTIILEYVGWYAAQGNTVYVDIWEIKPPVAFLPSYLFAHLTGTNMYAHHLLGIATTAFAFAAMAAFAAAVVGRLTGSPAAGLTTGVAFFAIPTMFLFPWMGYKAKFLAFACGMGAVERATADRDRSSGFLAGLAIGIWQLALVFPVIAGVYTIRRRSRAAVRAHAVGWLAATAVVVLTILLYADPAGILAEAVLGPFVLASERGAFDPEVYFRYFGDAPGRWLTRIGVAGLVLAAIDRRYPDRWPLALGGGLVAGVLTVDSDGLSDTIYPLLFTAIGVGVAVSYLPRRARVGSVLLLVLVLSTAFVPLGFFRQDPVTMSPTDESLPVPDAEREYVYWNAESVSNCRFFAGRTQRSILEYHPDGTALSDVPCGDLALYWNVTRHRLLGGPSPAVATGGEAPSTSDGPGARDATNASFVVGNRSARRWHRFRVTNRAGEPALVTVTVRRNGTNLTSRRYAFESTDTLTVKITTPGETTALFAVADGRTTSYRATVSCANSTDVLVITSLHRVAKQSTQTTTQSC